MERLIVYLLESVLVSGVLSTYYWIVLRNQKLHGFNRGYLLGVLVLSLGLPLVRIDWTPFAFGQGQVLDEALSRVEMAGRGVDSPLTWVKMGCWVAGVVSLLLLMVSLGRVVALDRIRRRETGRSMEGYRLIETDDPRAPFSFFSNLFWRRGVDPEDAVNGRILRHELAHIDGRHSWDSLFAQALCCVFWMNPFFWIIRRELRVIHEFIADAATGMEGDTEGFARMLLQSMNEGRWLEPAQGFFQSPIKRRLVMVNNERVSRFCAVRKTLVAPVVLAVLVLVSCSKDPGSLVTDRAKLQKQAIDTKVRKLISDGVFKEAKEREIAAAKAGKTPIEYKQLLEQKILEAEKQMKEDNLKPAQ